MNNNELTMYICKNSICFSRNLTTPVWLLSEYVPTKLAYNNKVYDEKTVLSVWTYFYLCCFFFCLYILWLEMYLRYVYR